MKLSARKGTLPGRKQVFRLTADGVALADMVARRDETLERTPLLEPAMLGGRRVKASAPLSELRERSEAMIAACPRPCAAWNRWRNPIPWPSMTGCRRTPRRWRCI